MNYTSLKQLAKASKSRIKDLIALSPQNDPFYVGTQGDKALAEWFAARWQQFGFIRDVHLRRIHYRIVSQEQPVICPNGKPLEKLKPKPEQNSLMK